MTTAREFAQRFSIPSSAVEIICVKHGVEVDDLDCIPDGSRPIAWVSFGPSDEDVVAVPTIDSEDE